MVESGSLGDKVHVLKNFFHKNVKSFFHFMLAFAPWVRKVVPVKTRGATDLDACAALSFREAVHPFQRVDDWRPADRRRRGLEAPAAYAG